MGREITIRELRQPGRCKAEERIRWLAESLGLAGKGASTSEKILACLLTTKAEEGMATEAVARALKISPQRVNYHVRTLVSTGLLYREKKKIFLRQGSIKGAVEELRRDANRILDAIAKTAEEVDEEVGLHR